MRDLSVIGLSKIGIGKELGIVKAMAVSEARSSP